MPLGCWVGERPKRPHVHSFTCAQRLEGCVAIGQMRLTGGVCCTRGHSRPATKSILWNVSGSLGSSHAATRVVYGEQTSRLSWTWWAIAASAQLVLEQCYHATKYYVATIRSVQAVMTSVMPALATVLPVSWPPTLSCCRPHDPCCRTACWASLFQRHIFSWSCAELLSCRAVPHVC